MKLHLSLLALTLAGTSTAALAQDDIFGVDSAATEVSDLQEAIEDDADRDTFTFGNSGREVGTWGSVALRGTIANSASGDDVTTLGIGGNYGFYDGKNASEFNLSYAYNSTNGVTDKDTLSAGYDYTRDFSGNFFGYGALNVKWDSLAALPTDNKRDAFLGLGVGYRIVDSASTQWAVKAGPGYRFIEKGDGSQVDEAAYSLESNLFYRFNETVYLSNDTTLIGSASDQSLANEIALNVAMSDALALRTSYVTEFNGADLGSLSRSSDTFGVSVVYNFN